MKDEHDELSWMEKFSTISIRRADSERLEKLAQPRKNKKPYQRRLEHKYEVITRALDLLEKTQAEGETIDNETQREVLG